MSTETYGMSLGSGYIRRKPIVPGPCVSAAVMVLVCVLAVPATAFAEPIECWRGWGYRMDRTTRSYKSGELLLVTRGPAVWGPGRPVELYLLDRASGRISPDTPPITVIPLAPRARYRGRSNYVDGQGPIAGSEDDLTFGLSHVSPPTAELKKLQDFNRWACGLEEGE